MLKFLFFLMGFYFFFKKKYWMGQNMFFILFSLMLIFFDLNWYYMNYSFMFSFDIFSFGLLMLTIWICGLMIMSMSCVNNQSLFYFMILTLLLFLFLTFSTLNFFLFYLFFEMSLIPTVMLILGWGYQPERMQAGGYLLFYTLFGSLPLLLGIFYLNMSFFSLNIKMFNKMSISLGGGVIFYLSIIFAFLVKMPMFLVHLWLPKAHVEAPVAGSMILAAVLLKLGGYGIIRVLNLFSLFSLKYNIFWIGLSLMGGIFVSFICLRQVDLKSLVAYSSVSHMGLALSGLMTLSFWGVQGGYLMMISHGLCSSGLFCLVNLVYERTGTRSLFINRGMMNFLPSLSIWWFLLCSCNMAAPPSLNLLSEIFLFNSLISWSFLTMLSISLISFFSAAYSLYLFSFSQHGQVVSSIFSYLEISFLEYLLLFLHWLPINFLILKSEVVLFFI